MDVEKTVPSWERLPVRLPVFDDDNRKMPTRTTRTKTSTGDRRTFSYVMEE